jgi:hypothetical protein
VSGRGREGERGGSHYPPDGGTGGITPNEREYYMKEKKSEMMIVMIYGCRQRERQRETERGEDYIV